MICRFNLTPGGLRGKQYADNRYRIWQVETTWSTFKLGVVSIEIIETNTRQLQRVPIDDFREYLTKEQLIEI